MKKNCFIALKPGRSSSSGEGKRDCRSHERMEEFCPALQEYLQAWGTNSSINFFKVFLANLKNTLITFTPWQNELQRPLRTSFHFFIF
jgi:hypothetical protein